MKCFSRFNRLTRFLSAATVATITLAVTVHAITTVNTPNAATYSYNLVPGASSASITPIASQAVWVVGVQNASGYRGVGRVALLHVPSSFLEWTGIESPASAAITSGYSGTAGTHIVYLDYSHYVDIEVAGADSFVVKNSTSSPYTATGVVTLFW